MFDCLSLIMNVVCRLKDAKKGSDLHGFSLVKLLANNALIDLELSYRCHFQGLSSVHVHV